VLAELERLGLLLTSDATLPSVAGLVAGEPIRGSWWSHALAHEIYDVCQYLDHEGGAARVKLVASKVTFVHRALRSCVAAVGAAREPWQTRGLSPGAHRLLARVDERGAVRLDQLGGNREVVRARASAASELEKRLLVASDELHTETGAHARQLLTWQRWLAELSPKPRAEKLETARARLEEAVAGFAPESPVRQGLLPWLRARPGA